MEYLKTYIRGLLGLGEEETTNRFSSKRVRANDEVSSDEDSPAMKRLRALKKTSFPDIMAPSDDWPKIEKSTSKVRYVPIQIEAGHPSTSTPNLCSDASGGRVRNVPVKLVDSSELGTPARKPRVHTPVRPAIYAVIDDDDDHENKQIETPARKPRLPTPVCPAIYAVIDDDDDNELQNKQLRTPVRKPRVHSPVRPAIYAVIDDDDGNELQNRQLGSPAKKSRVTSPVRPAIYAVIDDDDGDDDHEVTYIQSKHNSSRKHSQPQSRGYVDLDEDQENECEQPEDVIFIKKCSPPPSEKQFKYFVSKNRHITDFPADQREQTRSPQYYRLLLNHRQRDRSMSPKKYSKFKAPAGITKGYKRPPTTVIPQWMQPLATSNSNSQSRNRYLNLNGNARSAISEVFNLDEKKSYQELIRRVAGSGKPISFSKPTEIINLADDAASFRSTQRYQKKSLDNMKLVERSVNAEKEMDSKNEYDPLTVASLNSSDSEVEIVPSESSTSSVRIDPVNSFRESLRDRAVTSNNWLANLDSKYKKKRQDTQDKVKDARRENDIISKVNYEQKLALLEKKLKYGLIIPESLIEEPQATVELPELTPEQEKLVNRALGPGPSGQLLVEKFNLRIHRRDLQTLAGLNWLNDEVINFYMNLLMQRSQERPDLPKVYAANTFFYPKLIQSGQPGLRRWTRKVDIFAHDLMVVPVHLGVHWCLSLVDFRHKRVQYLDSMGGRNQACLDALMKYLRDEHQDKKGLPFDDSGWRAECISKNIPQQMNGSDCGMFSCTFAEFSSRNAPFTFSQQHMPYLRRKAALEILQGKLLL